MFSALNQLSLFIFKEILIFFSHLLLLFSFSSFGRLWCVPGAFSVVFLCSFSNNLVRWIFRHFYIYMKTFCRKINIEKNQFIKRSKNAEGLFVWIFCFKCFKISIWSSFLWLIKFWYFCSLHNSLNADIHMNYLISLEVI